MNTYKLLIEYDGGKYHGWQAQKGLKTIQGAFFERIEDIFESRDFEFMGSGRTDKGVHALGQVAHLKIRKSRFSEKALLYKFNDSLPSGIVVKKIEMVDNAFNARKSAVSRRYLYHISRRPSSFHKDYIWWVKDYLNVSYMNSACSYLIGKHDFSNFSAEASNREDTVLTVYNAGILEFGDTIVFHICASKFLWKMVRKIVSELVSVGKCEKKPEDFKHYIIAPSMNNKIDATAPPSGLFLEKVFYSRNEMESESGIIVPAVHVRS
ncbi:MAG: tRNA pseudouridine(38-40) synthase TruA [Ignavibacteria bacterium]|nr:tRNA pseudouridine(38-40) synthase TruA [Ignavibacteria bacterium]